MRAISLMALVLTTACSTSEEFAFRGDDRPQHDQIIDAPGLAALQATEGVTVLDVRLVEDYEADPTLIPGAAYKDPENIEQWYSSVPPDSKVVVYCVKGKWVSQKAAHFLQSKGYDVYSLDGGIEGWRNSSNGER